MQREVIVGIDETCRIYSKITPSMKKSDKGLKKIISKTHRKIIKNIRTKEFDKLLAVADSGSIIKFWR